jgi:hypothetical protein
LPDIRIKSLADLRGKKLACAVGRCAGTTFHRFFVDQSVLPAAVQSDHAIDHQFINDLNADESASVIRDARANNANSIN